MDLITGGAGFIGSNLAASLAAEAGRKIAICDNPGEAAARGTLAGLDIAHQIDAGNLLDFLADNQGKISRIFHLGAISSTTETDVERIMRVNFQFSLDLWNWCAAEGVPLIYASSAATYGDGRAGFDDDWSLAALARLRPLNPYGWSKHAFDLHVAALDAMGGPRPPHWAGLKFFNVYGPNEYHKGGQQSVVPQIYKQIRETGKARLFQSHHPDYEDGGQLRDFIWVGDCVRVMRWLGDQPSVSGIFNCGTGKARTFADLAGAVFDAVDLAPDIEFIPTPENIRGQYQYFTEARMDRLTQAGYNGGFTELEDGVGRYVREHLATNAPFTKI